MAVKTSKQYRVVFAVDASHVATRRPGLIIVSLARDKWNDFGFRIQVDITIHPHGKKVADDPPLFAGYLGFDAPDAEHSDVRLIAQTLQGSVDRFVVPDKIPPFFTMLPDMSGYRRMVGELGPDDAKLALRALNDLVEAELGVGNRPWLRNAKASLIFQRAFMRNTEAYYALKNAGVILAGLEFEQLGGISNEINIRFQLAGRPNEHDLKFLFDNKAALPKRFAVVIGANGVGKSQTLGRIAVAALKGADNLTDQHGERPSFNRLLAFSPTAATSSVFPQRRRGSKVWYRRFSISGREDPRRRQATTADLIIQLARTDERITRTNRFGLFVDALSHIERHRELHLPVLGGGKETVPIAHLQQGAEQSILDRFAAVDLNQEPVRVIDGQPFPLSSGEQSFVRFAALASLYIENGTLLLFDEPETHLHPSLISQFVAVLDNLLERTGSAAIIATHSVYFVREVFEDQVRVLRSLSDRTIVVETPTLQTFGADVGAISYFVFGEDRPSRLAKEVEQRIAESSATWEEIFAEYKNDLSLELLGEIRARLSKSQAGDS